MGMVVVVVIGVGDVVVVVVFIVSTVAHERGEGCKLVLHIKTSFSFVVVGYVSFQRNSTKRKSKFI